MLIIAGHGYVDPDHTDDFVTGFIESMTRTRKEDGCLDYVVSADPLEAGRVNVLEMWESKEHLRKHLETMPPHTIATPVLSMLVRQYEIGAVGEVGS
ncbi:antibiotic biosynthesis monooxygenase [Actinoplanes sp. NPDC026619]|uniref:putative quinol monooxygenase n=1 Tax=Actinoplanes sp. NPDC026619 TaxID=3155798 RepID=UPI0033F47124